MVRTPHDALFKFTFSDPDNAAGILRSVLPAAVADRIDFDTLRLEPGSFIDEALSGRHSDCLFAAWLADYEVRIYLLFEHQSADDPLMALRLLEYLVRIWRAWLALEENRGKTKLPPILPIVLHHGESGWRAPRAMSEMYNLDAAALAALGRWLPQMRFLIDDLAVTPVDALRSRDLTGMAYLTALSLKLGRSEEDLSEWLARSPDALREAWDAGGTRAIIALVRYIMQVNGAARDDLETVIGRAIGEPGQEAVMTAAQRLHEEGFEQGLEKGREQERRALFHKLLATRFGTLSEAELDQIAEIDFDRIEALIDRIFVAETLANLLESD